MSCDREVANKLARCSGKNASYITKPVIRHIQVLLAKVGLHTPYADMADRSVVAWNELYESEASWASVFCFDNASSEKS